jgi:hypothetical protein
MGLVLGDAKGVQTVDGIFLKYSNLVYLLTGQSANIGGFERTFFLNSGEENFSPLRIMQDLYWG